MAENEDLELQALQRQLDDAFETTRPRRGFEDELWLRMQARRPLLARLRDGMAGLWDGAREAPAVPLAAVAVVLIAAVGVGILHAGGLSSFAPTQHTASMAGGTTSGPNVDKGLTGGKLPSPALHPGLVESTAPTAAGGPAQPTVHTTPANIYYGPATLTWTGQFPTAQVQAPVVSFVEPTSAQADQFAALLGTATNTQLSFGANGVLGTYAGPDFNVSVRSSIPQLPREPSFVLTSTSSSAAATVDPQQVATDFLTAHNLLPTWPDQVAVTQLGNQERVQFLRGFPLTEGGVAYLIDWNGERYGLEVNVSSGKAVSAAGPLPLPLSSTDYRLITNAQAAQAAVSEGPAIGAAIRPTPAVALDKVELVYALAESGGQGFYEPAYLFSGTFQYQGQTYTKRVLVPLVDPSLRSS